MLKWSVGVGRQILYPFGEDKLAHYNVFLGKTANKMKCTDGFMYVVLYVAACRRCNPGCGPVAETWAQDEQPARAWIWWSPRPQHLLHQYVSVALPLTLWICENGNVAVLFFMFSIILSVYRLTWLRTQDLTLAWFSKYKFTFVVSWHVLITIN